ncbi:unnamed protein product [Caenorhabditis auriculariae]|uniref:START domain-containing protein n=1 Tax=Caenorhabditis auriculariae TaxID=2777116 RepID=A0A8S1GX45_9PELO|nr:unnamed protein product [Caenorhabditis auriculariae]
MLFEACPAAARHVLDVRCTFKILSSLSSSYLTFSEESKHEKTSRRRILTLLQKMSGRQPLIPTPSTRRLSKDRRRFLVVVFFDMAITVLLWLICTVTRGDDWRKVFFNEVNIFNEEFFKESLFDLVLLSSLRMLLLTTVYGCCVSSTSVVVAFTTLASSSYIVVKVLFFFNRLQNSVPQFLLVITSFSLCWFELYLMPFKILPRERRHARAILDNEYYSSDEEHPRSRTSARSRVPRRNVASSASNAAAAISRRNLTFSDNDEFRSAVEFSSDDENRLSRLMVPPEMRRQLETALSEGEKHTEELLRDSMLGGWKSLRSEDPLVMQGPDGYFLVRAEFPSFPALVLFNIAWKDMLKWNTQVLEGKAVAHLDHSTDLYYSVSAPAMRGYISSRDFLDVRRIHLDAAKNVYSGYFVSVESSLCPKNANPKIVRGHNYPSLIRTHSKDPLGTAHFEWLMKTDLKGGLPRRLVQSGMVTYFTEHVRRMREFATTHYHCPQQVDETDPTNI